MGSFELREQCLGRGLGTPLIALALRFRFCGLFRASLGIGAQICDFGYDLLLKVRERVSVEHPVNFVASSDDPVDIRLIDRPIAFAGRSPKFDGRVQARQAAAAMERPQSAFQSLVLGKRGRIDVHGSAGPCQKMTEDLRSRQSRRIQLGQIYPRGLADEQALEAGEPGVAFFRDEVKFLIVASSQSKCLLCRAVRFYGRWGWLRWLSRQVGIVAERAIGREVGRLLP
ncbi:hypothetical protein [Bradyrhizobium sp. USDA 4452]